MSSAFILSGAPASPILLRSGQATIPQNLQLIAVVDASITASSVVVASAVSDNGVVPAAQSVAVCLQAGVGFTIRSSAVATNPGSGLVCQWAVLKY